MINGKQRTQCNLEVIRLGDTVQEKAQKEPGLRASRRLNLNRSPSSRIAWTRFKFCLCLLEQLVLVSFSKDEYTRVTMPVL